MGDMAGPQRRFAGIEVAGGEVQHRLVADAEDEVADHDQIALPPRPVQRRPGGQSRLGERRRQVEPQDAGGAVGVALPFRPAQQLRRPVLGGEERQAEGVAPGRIGQPEGGLHRPLRQIQQPGQVARRLSARSRRVEGGSGRIGRAGGEGNAEQPLPVPRQALAQPVVELGRVEHAEQLDVIGRQHDAVIGRAPADVAAARRHGEAEPAPGVARRIQRRHRQDDVVEPGDRRHQKPPCSAR